MRVNGVRVDTRAELESYLRNHPMQLRAARPSPTPRPGQAEFIGPVPLGFLERLGALQFESDGSPFVVVQKEPWERERDEKLRSIFGGA